MRKILVIEYDVTHLSPDQTDNILDATYPDVPADADIPVITAKVVERSDGVEINLDKLATLQQKAEAALEDASRYPFTSMTVVEFRLHCDPQTVLELMRRAGVGK